MNTAANIDNHELLLGFMGISFQELLVVLLIVLILFGAKRLPELAKGLGSGLREFKKAAKEIESVKDEDNAKTASGETPDSSKPVDK